MFFGRAAPKLDYMIGVSRRVAKRVAGLELRLENCTCAEVSRRVALGATVHAAGPHTHHVQHMAKAPPITCLKVLGAYIQLE